MRSWKRPDGALHLEPTGGHRISLRLARIDARKGGNREKILLGKWVLGSKLKLIRVENMPLKEGGRDEFFRMVDSITSTLIYDPVIRTMREQY